MGLGSGGANKKKEKKLAKRVAVGIRGSCDYLQHKRPLEAEDTSKRSGEIDHSKEWKTAVYSDKENGCYIPSKQLRASLVKGAVNFKIKGRMGKTFKDLVNATIEIDPDKVPLGKKEPDYIHEEFVKIQRNQILRRRPAFEKGWKAKFTLLVLDDQMPLDKLKEILEYSGSFVGIGDWRPHFGRFEVVKFDGAKK